jgi:hypothetical protein
MIADIPAMTQQIQHSLSELILVGKLNRLVGHKFDFQRLGIVNPITMEVVPSFKRVEIVATDASGPVHIWFASDEHWEEYSINSSGLPGAGFLGSGDAYTGSYLAARILGKSEATSNDIAQREAQRLSYDSKARRNCDANLADMFGSFILRSSSEEDWHLYNRIRLTAGATVISCNNSGVDEAGIRAAKRLGLPCFSVMPKGGRREGLESDSSSHRIELGTDSYRFCTWANVYLSDGTVLLDISRREGSEETRRAASFLNRPLFEITFGMNEKNLQLEVSKWAELNGIRVVNLAGSRATYLSENDLSWIKKAMKRTVMGIASTFDKFPKQRHNLNEPEEFDKLIIGIPSLEEVSSALLETLSCQEPEITGDLDSMLWEFNKGRIIRGKSRDLVQAVSKGDIEAAIVGSDMVLDSSNPQLVIIGQSGAFNCIVGLVGRGSILDPIERVCTQYPGFAKRITFLAGRFVETISGSSEGWVAEGIFDATIDTWRTGQTAELHGLNLLQEIERTSLCVVSSTKSIDSLGTSFALDLLRKLTEGN